MNDRLTQSDIDKMQKDAIAANAIGTCNTCVIAPVFNTKPITFSNFFRHKYQE